MELKITRKIKNESSTIGELSVNGVFECYICEDKDRGLKKSDPLSVNESKKVYGVTAIPTGRYEVAITFSDRFQKYLPLLIGVPAYEGIRIHPGNTAADSLGCLLPGTTTDNIGVQNSRVAFDALFKKLKAVEKKEKIFITIE